MTTNPDKLANIFEFCLSQLDSGMSMDEILKNAGDYEEEMRPLLETAIQTMDEDPIPIGAIHRSRTRLLGQAQQLRSRKPVRSRISFRRYRFVMRLLVALLVVGASLTSLFAVSAQAVPGDNLYGIKRFGESARLSIALPGSRGNLEKTFQLRRIDEIKELMSLGRSAPVAFEAIVTEISADRWEVGGLTVHIQPSTEIIGDIETGMFVEVVGRTASDGRLMAASIYLRAYAFIGTVESINGPVWTIKGTAVRIRAESQLSPGISIGTRVVVLASVDNEGVISARAVLLADDREQLQDENLLDLSIPTEEDVPTPTPTPTASPSPTETETEEVEVEPTEDDEEEHSGSSSEETDTPEPTDDPDETEDPDETDEPDNTRTPEPTKTEDPDDD